MLMIEVCRACKSLIPPDTTGGWNEQSPHAWKLGKMVCPYAELLGPDSEIPPQCPRFFEHVVAAEAQG